MWRWGLAGMVAAHAAFACTCSRFAELPEAFSGSSFVFSGVVESTEIDLIDYIADEKLMRMPDGPEIPEGEWQRRLNRDESKIVSRLKIVFRDRVPDPFLGRLESAKSLRDLESLLSRLPRRGLTTRLRAMEVWKGGSEPSFHIWQPEGDSCNVRFEVGQAFLLYASRDREGRLTLQQCSRNGLLRTSAEDLAYLHFVKYQPQASTRMFGSIVVDEAGARRPYYGGSSQAPLVLQLTSRDGTRYIEAGAYGEYIADGLAGGDYRVTVWSAPFPHKRRILKGPITVRVPTQGFARQEISVPHDLLQNRPATSR